MSDYSVSVNPSVMICSLEGLRGIPSHLGQSSLRLKNELVRFLWSKVKVIETSLLSTGPLARNDDCFWWK